MSLSKVDGKLENLTCKVVKDIYKMLIFFTRYTSNCILGLIRFQNGGITQNMNNKNTKFK